MAEEAVLVFKKDLEINPSNVWALTGLHQSLMSQNKATEAKAVRKLLDSVLKETDLKIDASVF